MTIYLVRWPDLSASLVRAEDEDELLNILDQVANSEGCKWSVYNGPLFIDFRLPVDWSIEDDHSEQPIRPEQITVGDVGRLAEDVVGAIQLSLAEGEDGLDTGTEVIRLAFPELQAVMDRSCDRSDVANIDESLPEAEIRSALHAELARLVRASWRHAHLRNKQDRASELALQMGLPVALAQKCVEASEKIGTRDHSANETGVEGNTRSEPLFAVSNQQAANSGALPVMNANDPHSYCGYFANEYGEQTIYWYDRTTGEATIRMGDAGWQHVYRVVDGCVAGVDLTKAEATWLGACWMASAGTGNRPLPRGAAR